MDTGPPTNIRRMPTRVSSACCRCRRNKSRCDHFRPCSLCTRANVPCEPSILDRPARVRPGRSERRQRAVLRERAQYRGGSEDGLASPGQLREQPTPAPETETRLGDTGSTMLTERSGSFTQAEYDGSESAMSIARKIYRLGSRGMDDHATSAIPDGGMGVRALQTRVGDKRVPISVILCCSRFPDHQLILSLVEDYFQTVHWFSLVVYEPKFRQSLAAMEDGYAYSSETPFLLLLATVLCMAAWYRSQRSGQSDAETWRLWSDDLIKIVESRLVYIMDQRSIAAVQTCILLGSHHVYHGRPNRSFALLGATIKMACALGLHRESARCPPEDREERRRVWWTIYTWDRFASISYGRPLSIHDAEYQVEFPSEFTESPYFTPESVELGLPGISYSPYQTELSRLYRIASPVLMSIFNPPPARPMHKSFEAQYASLVNEVTRKMISWRRHLPPHLSLDLDRDYDPRTRDLGRQAHTLQSLSLQLTFDNLLIVLHRPFLSRQVEHLSMKTAPMTTSCSLGTQSMSPMSQSNTPSTASRDSPSPGWEKSASSEYWWSAAVRTTRVSELPQLAQLATDSHLVAFMVMNLFHAAIVLIVVALADPLSDLAQSVKRTISRVFRLQELLGRRSTLSNQSSIVLKNLIRLLLQRERECMLGSVPSCIPSAIDAQAEQPTKTTNEAGLLSVEDMLRLPTDGVMSAQDQSLSMNHQDWPNPNVTQRLNESLASVQRVFPAVQDEFLPSNASTISMTDQGQECEQDQQQQQQQQTMQLPLTGQDLCQVPFGKPDNYECPQPVADQTVDYNGHGLFWLWDSNWNGGAVL